MEITQNFIDNVNKLIIKKHIDNVKLISLGFIPKFDYSLYILPILVDAFNNKEIFNKKQLNNLEQIYNHFINGN